MPIKSPHSLSKTGNYQDLPLQLVVESHTGQSTSTRKRRITNHMFTTNRVATNYWLSIFLLLLLASLKVSSDKSFHAFVSACEKNPRSSPASPGASTSTKLFLASTRSVDNLSTRISATTAAGSCLLTASANSKSNLDLHFREEDDADENDNCRENNECSHWLQESSTSPSSSSSFVSIPPLAVVQDEYLEYQRRKNDWVQRYTSLESLRETFGSNKNKFWGDLDAASARRLYKTLLPKALLELVQAGVQPEDLAPLAYQARVAAKLYARERCHLPARIMANLYDGFRTLKRYGRFQPVGMSYEQVWEKYQKAVLENLQNDRSDDEDGDDNDGDDDFIDTDRAIRHICMKILESSCRTNEAVDRWVLASKEDASARNQREDLIRIAQTLEEDVKKLLQPMSSSSSKKKRHYSSESKSRQARSVLRWILQLKRHFRRKLK